MPKWVAMSVRILSLHIYPIKSCAGIGLTESLVSRAGLAHDRRWVLIGDDGQFMTQRQWSAMALIRTALTADALRLSAPGMADLDLPLDSSARQVGVETIGVWKDTLEARCESDAAAQWCSAFLKTSCRLYKVGETAARPAKPEWVEKWRAKHPDLADAFGGDHFFGFADGFPLLVVNQTSLDDLNARLQAKGAAPVLMNRFRPNIVLQGEWEAFEEDHTAMITTGEVGMAFVRPCTRCSIPDIDPRTAVRHDEPGRTLAGYRNLGGGVVFGQNAIVNAPADARLKVGDEVAIELDF